MGTLQNAINKAHNPELSEQYGSVYQLWDDGEITLQKCGDLLWYRSLHTMMPAIINEAETELYLNWPDKLGNHGFAFMLRSDAESIREKMKESLIDIINQN